MEVKRWGGGSCLLAGGLVLFAVVLRAQPPKLPASSLPLQLTGVMADDATPARSLCFVRCLASDERHGALGIGDVACGQAEIKEIRPDVVVIRNVGANRLELLSFPTPVTPGAASAFSPAPAADSSVASGLSPAPAAATVEVPKVTVDKYLAHLDDVLESALAVPHYSESTGGQKTMDGFTISRIKQGGAAEQVGLHDGDVVQEINGQPLDDMVTVMALFGRLPTMTQAKVRLLRAGQPMTVVINVK